jgi:hypothetical protein
MTDTTAPTTSGQPSIQDHVHAQKQTIVAKAQEMVNMAHGMIDAWTQNFVMAEKVKVRRTDQVNFLLQFINQMANEGVPQINIVGNEIKNPSISNQVLECNNIIMNAARNVLTNIQQQETAFQAELHATLNPTEASPKTEVKVSEA